MPITSADEISVVLSGGTVNINPNNSLGGPPSSSPIVDGGLNNLFDDVAPKEAEEGHEDYRCIYFFNDGEAPIFLVNIWIASESSEGATIELGIEERDETQRITLDNGVITDGSFTLSLNGVQFTSSHNNDLGVWATALQTTMNSLIDVEGGRILTNVVVSSQQVTSTRVIFDINFKGADGSRNHPELQLVSNNIVPSIVDIGISSPQEGSPVNTEASSIGLETTPPGGVGFFSPSELSPISLPRLDPEDGFPLWVKRTTPIGTSAKDKDGFQLRLSGESLSPTEES